ncbi:MAG: oligosaccharide flippase family protein [Candidatus Pacebacteria bacterium]|nr:oligosaccharide flippase family protein [Candidatus Paceibacterota bacterium]
MSVMNTFLKGETVSAAWNFSSKGIGLVNTFITITSLSLYQYGVFQLLLSFAGIPSDFLNLGSGLVSNEISRAIGDNRIADAKRIFIEYALIRVVIMIGVWVTVFFGATHFFSAYDTSFVKDMRLISFLFLSEGLFMIIRTFCLVRLEFGIVALRTTITKFIQFLILGYFLLQGNLGLKQLIWSIIFSSAISVVIISFKFFKVYSTWNHVKIPSKVLLWNIFLTYGTWDVTRQFANRVTFRIKPWLIKIFASTEAVAIFSIAETMVTTVQDVLPNNTLQSLVPLWVKDSTLSRKMFSYGVKYYAVMGIVLAVLAAFIIPSVTHIFFSKYNDSLQYFYFMLFNLPIFAVGIIIGNYIIALRKQRYLLFLHVIRNICSLTIITVGLYYVGLWGLALEFVVVPLMLVCINYWYTQSQDRGFHFDFKVIFSFNAQDREIIKKSFLQMRQILLRY